MILDALAPRADSEHAVANIGGCIFAAGHGCHDVGEASVVAPLSAGLPAKAAGSRQYLAAATEGAYAPLTAACISDTAAAATMLFKKAELLRTAAVQTFLRRLVWSFVGEAEPFRPAAEVGLTSPQEAGVVMAFHPPKVWGCRVVVPERPVGGCGALRRRPLILLAACARHRDTTAAYTDDSQATAAGAKARGRLLGMHTRKAAKAGRQVPPGHFPDAKPQTSQIVPIGVCHRFL